MRLIDADELEKDANEELLSETYTDEEFYWNDGAKSIIDLIKTAPTMDAVPVVRCKDCKYWERDAIFNEGWCRGNRQDNPDWFCADGERSE